MQRGRSMAVVGSERTSSSAEALVEVRAAAEGQQVQSAGAVPHGMAMSGRACAHTHTHVRARSF